MLGIFFFFFFSAPFWTAEVSGSWTVLLGSLQTGGRTRVAIFIPEAPGGAREMAKSKPVTGYAQPGQKHWSNPSLQTKFRNSIQCLYRKQFQRQRARGQYQCLVENQLDPLIVLFPARVANDHEASCQKICMTILTIAIALQFFVCCKSALFGTIVNNVCRQHESSCPVQSISL